MTDATLLGDVLDVIGTEDFWMADHGRLLELLEAMGRHGKAIDQITVPNAILRTGDPARFGGVPYVLGLPDRCPSVLALPAWLEEVMDASKARSLMGLCEQALARSAATSDASQLVRKMSDIIDRTTTRRSDVKTLAEAVRRRANSIAELQESGASPRHPTGWPCFDVLFDGGLAPSRFHLLGARPSVGKSAVMGNMAVGLAKNGAKVGIISLEMDHDELSTRVIAANGEGLTVSALNQANVDQHAWESILGVQDRMAQLP